MLETNSFFQSYPEDDDRPFAETLEYLNLTNIGKPIFHSSSTISRHEYSYKMKTYYVYCPLRHFDIEAYYLHFEYRKPVPNMVTEIE